MSDQVRAYSYLHFCVFIWGFTAILGKLISLQALPLVWWRVVLCCIGLLFVVPLRLFVSMPRRRFWELFGIGVLVGIHWLCFYGAIKIANASVAVASMALTSFSAALVEPWLLRTRIKPYELGLGLLILPGVALLVGNIDWTMRIGFGLGILGAVLAAVFSTLNKRVLNHLPPPPLAMSLLELFAAVCVTSLALPFVWAQNPQLKIWPAGDDWRWLMLLAGVCTLLPYYLTLLAMRHLSAFTANLIINLEPVYGVLLATLIFREDLQLEAGFYWGVLIILVAVFSHPFLKKKFEPQQA
ncbi:MAG TPA: DMT family transporter [Saprospiraceae bacterium]|nr:DMT family transporter [Saprospiraceae bacterium]